MTTQEREYQAINAWQTEMLSSGRHGDVTIHKYRYALMRLASESRPPKSLLDITATDVVVFLASLGKHAHSKSLYLSAFRSFFGWAHDNGYMAENPAADLHVKGEEGEPEP